jgi:innexin
MIPILSTLKWRGPTSSSENWIIMLHYGVTPFFLLSFSFILSSKQYLSDPIVCLYDGKISSDYVNNYCWTNGTFTVDKNTFRYHNYYQYVSLFLLLQATMFYIPHLIWTQIDSGNSLENIHDISDKFSFLRKYIIIFTLYVAIVTIQFPLLSYFLETNYLTFGYILAKKGYRTVKSLFPIISKCSYYAIGFSGDKEYNNAQCILTLNTLNDKLFVFLWFWFIVLLIIDLVYLLQLVIITTSTRGRIAIFNIYYNFDKHSNFTFLENAAEYFFFNLEYMNKGPPALHESVNRKVGQI